VNIAPIDAQTRKIAGNCLCQLLVSVDRFSIIPIIQFEFDVMAAITASLFTPFRI
jgi:hypothetical protein